MMTFAKAITTGYFPLGGVLINEGMVESFEQNNDAFGAIGHGYTYSGHPVGCAAALATLEETERLQVAKNARDMGALLLPGLKQLEERFDIVGNSRGIGLMAGLELVSDPEKKTPVDKDVAQAFFEGTYDAGVMARVSGNNVLISPPLVIDENDVARMLNAFEAGLQAATNKL